MVFYVYFRAISKDLTFKQTIKTMKKSIVLVFMSITMILSASAQDEEKKKLKLEDYLNPKMYPEYLRNLQWAGDNERFTYIDNNTLIRGTVKSETRDTILKADQLNAALNQAGIDSIKRMPSVHWLDNDRFYFYKDTAIIRYTLAQNQADVVNRFSTQAKNKDLYEDQFWLAFTRDKDLFVAMEDEEIRVTNDGGDGIVNGDEVHRREFGISKGTFWSPDATLLAFYRKDESMVTDYPLVNMNKRIAEVEHIKYPMAGMKSHHVTMGVFDMSTRETIFLKTGKPLDKYLTNVTWGPNGEYIYIAVLNRDQDYMKLNKYSAETGELVKTIFEEKDEQYVEPMHGPTFFNENPDHFIWQSRRDGYNHLYVYDTEGTFIKQLTKGNWKVTDLAGLDKNDRFAYFTATKESPIENHIYSVKLSNEKIRKLSSAPGTHRAKLSPGGDYLFDTYSSMNVTRKYQIIDDKGNIEQELLNSRDPFEDYATGNISIFTVPDADSTTDLYCRLIKPSDFDSTKQYPVFIYVYGGPHSQLVSNTWLGSANFFLMYMAQQGYLVFTMDNRGTNNRGLEFEQIIHRQLGIVEVADQMQGVKYLKSLPYVDTARIGVDGWSYGGFMTLSMLTKHPEAFKLGCAGGPVTDWKYYEVMYGERYMDTPEQNPEGYKKASILNKADQLEDNVLIIHNTYDNTVMWQNSLKFIKECVNHGKQVEYFVYPDHEHNVRGKDRVHLYRKIAKFFDENL